MRFIADSMLGRLAKSLRMLGFDVAYDPFIADRRLLAQARRERRIVLTRDTGMLRRRDLPPLDSARDGPEPVEGPRLVFITSDHLRDQLAQVAGELGVQLDRSALFTRCIVCNGELDAARKESVRAEVPPYVYETQQAFARCRGCGRIYWRGTHVADMQRRLDDLGVA